MRAAIYTRISRDTRDPDAERGLGIERQREDCAARCDHNGWTIVSEYAENDVSASTNSRRPRPEYSAMLAAVRAGEIDVIVAYSNSRLTRRPLELEELIRLHDEHGIRVSTVVSGEDDLGTADGRQNARLRAAIDAGEAERASERLKRQKAQRAMAGKPQGGRHRVFGYDRQFGVIPSEAQVVGDIFERKARGQSFTSIAKHLNASGHRTAAGMEWTASNVGKLVSRSGYCGLRTYNGEIVAKTTYEAIVSEEVWQAANAEAARVASPGVNARKHLLTGFLTCGRCGHRMGGNAAAGGYRCTARSGGCGALKVAFRWLDGPIVSLVLAREASRSETSRPAPPAVGGPTADEIRQEIADLRTDYVAGLMSRPDWLLATNGLRERERLIEETMAQTRLGISGPITTLTSWSRMDLSQRRVLVGQHLDMVTIGPRVARGPGRFEPERYQVRWCDGSTQGVSEAELNQIPQWRPESNTWTLPPGVLLAGDVDSLGSEVDDRPLGSGFVGEMVVRF